MRDERLSWSTSLQSSEQWWTQLSSTTFPLPGASSSTLKEIVSPYSFFNSFYIWLKLTLGSWEQVDGAYLLLGSDETFTAGGGERCCMDQASAPARKTYRRARLPPSHLPLQTWWNSKEKQKIASTSSLVCHFQASLPQLDSHLRALWAFGARKGRLCLSLVWGQSG